MFSKRPMVHGASDAVGLILKNDQNEILLQLRSLREEEFGGKWTLPGGKVGEKSVSRTLLDKIYGELGLRAAINGYKLNELAKVQVVNKDYELVHLSLYAYAGGPLSMNNFRNVDSLAVPAFGFFSFENLLDMKEAGELHPSTAFAVDHIQRVKEEQGRCLLTEGYD